MVFCQASLIWLSTSSSSSSFDESKLLPQNKTSINLIRVAFHKKDMPKALTFCGRLKKLGYSVSANAMATINYNEDELNELIKLSDQYNLDYLCRDMLTSDLNLYGMTIEEAKKIAKQISKK